MSNKEHIKLWIDGLRSGKYVQGLGQLHSKNDEFCCLGVACEVAIENGLEVKKEKTKDGFKYDFEYNYLPETVRNWLGFGYDVQTDPAVGIGINAVRANDELNWTFAEIADSLERVYLNNGE